MPSFARACVLLCAAALFLAPTAARLGAADSDDARQQLADAQDRLATALRSYSLLQDENARLKDQLNAAQADKAAAVARIAAQFNALREQLRQANDQVAALAQANYQLRQQLAAASGRK